MTTNGRRSVSGENAPRPGEPNDAEKLAQMDQQAAKQFPDAVPVMLPPVGSVTGPVRVLAGTDPNGQTWVRIIFTPPGQISVMDFPAEIKETGEHPAEDFAEMLADSGRQARSGLIRP